MWNFAFSFASYFFTLQRNQRPPVVGGLMDMVGRVLLEGFLLELLWEFCNAIFTDHVAGEPLKRGQPLTNDSKDPNGSLLQGLRAKKEVPREFAFWELELIATRFDDRRKSIFTELEVRTPLATTAVTEKSPLYKNKSEQPISRNKATWTHISTVCLEEIQRIDKRIKLVLDPPQKLTPEEQQAAIHTLPKLGIDPLKKDDILALPTPPTDLLSKTIDHLDSLARTHGQSPGSPDPVTPRAQRLLASTANTLAPPPPGTQPVTLRHQLTTLRTRLLASPLGLPFRATFARRVAAVVLGAPCTRTGTLQRAASALAALVGHAPREDMYGLVARDVPGIVRALAGTLESVERLRREMGVHWTEVEFAEEDRGKAGGEQVESVRRGLAEALEKVLWAYGEYLESEGLSREEIVRARECVGRVKGQRKA
ncbi:MAG: hypothetical protein M1821_005956 [Bathelium mastoideum]|nr:MAG: hypothetical protein M1821_005956 [Bathelium mastoideum]